MKNMKNAQAVEKTHTHIYQYTGLESTGLKGKHTLEDEK